jgi:hypothetical protein
MTINGKLDHTAEALRATLISATEEDQNLESANVVDGLFAIARALEHIAHEIKYLGNGNASTEGWGAIESVGHHLGEKLDRLAEAVPHEIAVTINTAE